jgi:hypothetical protein
LGFGEDDVPPPQPNSTSIENIKAAHAVYLMTRDIDAAKTAFMDFTPELNCAADVA